MPQLYVLYEHASGFALFRTTEFEEIAIFLPQVQSSILNVSKFRSIVYVIAFQSFENTRDALETMKSVKDGVLNKELQLFLETNVPKTKKSKQSVALGVQDTTLASAITETLGIDCATSGAVIEIIRGIRYHFSKLVKGYKEPEAISKAELALAHHYSRKRVNFDSKRADMLVIQTLDSVNQLDNDINTFCTRIRGWYSNHFPELYKLVPENSLYIQCVKVIGDRKAMPVDIESLLETILGGSGDVQNILEAASRSMGMDISDHDMENIQTIIGRVMSLVDCQKDLVEYLKFKMREVAPNLSVLVGEMVGAQLISRAGSLAWLAKMPSSTVQVLGAPKALFRNWKASNAPFICGILRSSTIMKKRDKVIKKFLSRLVANKCCLAARADYFNTRVSDKFGHILLEEIENMLKNSQNKKLRIEQNSVLEFKQTKRRKRKRKKQNTSHVSSVDDVMTEQDVLDGSDELCQENVVGDKNVNKLSKRKRSTILTAVKDESELETTKKKKRKLLKKKKQKVNDV